MGSFASASRGRRLSPRSNYDEHGLCWPREITPTGVRLGGTGKDDEVYLKAQEIVRPGNSGEAGLRGDL